MIELIALLVALATPDDQLNYLAVGHMSGSRGAWDAGVGNPGSSRLPPSYPRLRAPAPAGPLRPAFYRSSLPGALPAAEQPLHEEI
jgi:hypothetical protein